jgi:acetolactate synthase-1/2/3 large subunit
VFLEIHEDALVGEIDEDAAHVTSPERYRALGQPAIEEGLVLKSMEMLARAERPLIVSGGGVARAGAWDELRDLAEHLQIPVITSLMGMGTMPNRSRCFIGSSILGTAMIAAGGADVVLCLGSRFTYTLGYGIEPFWKDSQEVIQVDIDPAMIGRNKPISLGVTGDCGLFLKQLLREAKKGKRVEKREWLEGLAAMREQAAAPFREDAGPDDIPMSSKRLVREVYTFMDEDAILTLDGGEIEAFALEQVDVHKPRHPLSTLQPVGMGHLGTAIPYGIGAKLARPDRQVIAIAGDGAFMFNIQDLETASRLGLKNLIYVVGNNGAWGSMKSIQKISKEGRYIDVDFPGFDFAACARAFGCHGEAVTDPADLRPALKRAKESNKPAVIDARTRYETAAITEMLISVSL